MFFIVLTLIVLLPAMAGWGALIQKILRSGIDGLAGKTFIGIFLVALLFQNWAFFEPLHVWLEVGILMIGLLSFFFSKTYLEIYKLTRLQWSIFLSTGILAILAGSFYPFILDHFGYYLPSILWVKSFGLTQGLSNLDLIYGQMSVWHIFQAGISHVVDPQFRVNVFLLITFLLYLVERKAWSLLLLFPVFLLFVQSPSPDLPASILALVVLYEVLLGNKNTTWLFALATFVFVIKPTMFWVPLFIFIYLFNVKKLQTYLLGSFVIVLYVFKNIWLFGYPFFPMAIGDFGISWIPNAEVMHRSSEIAVLKAYDMQYSLQQIQQWTFLEKVYHWFSLASFKKYIHGAFIIALIGLVAFLFAKKGKLYRILAISILIKSIFVLTFSAQYRFFLDIFLLVPVVFLFEKITWKPSFYLSFLGSVMVLLVLSFPTFIQTQVPTFRLGHYMQGFTEKQLLKPAFYQLNRYQKFKIGNLDLFLTDYDLSFDTPQPSVSFHTLKTYDEVGIFPQKKGKEIKDGLIWRKMNPKEKQELKAILKSLEKK